MLPKRAVFVVSKDADSRFAMVDDVPVTQEGEIVSWVDRINSSYLLLNVDDPRPFGDCLFILGDYLMVSDATWRLFEKFLLDPEIWGTRIIVNHKTSRTQHTFWWLRSHREWQVVDWTLSNVRYVPGTKIVSHANEWVLQQNELPEFDVFVGDDDRWFVSAEVRLAFEQHGLSNFEFTPCTMGSSNEP
jgi:hypothetical protein